MGFYSTEKARYSRTSGLVRIRLRIQTRRSSLGIENRHLSDRICIIQTEAPNVSYFQKRNKLRKTFSQIQLTLLTGLKKHFDLDWQNIKIVYSVDFQQDKHFESNFLDRTNNV